jgi:hypothetical protein
MNFYQVTIHSEQIFYPNVVHDTVIKDSTIDAWWHYLPNVWLIRTTQDATYHSNRILRILPGLSFLIVKIDLNDYNGYLPQAAWDWIKAHSAPKPTYKSLPDSPLLDAIRRAGELPPLPPIKQTSGDLLTELLKNRLKKS